MDHYFLKFLLFNERRELKNQQKNKTGYSSDAG